MNFLTKTNKIVLLLVICVFLTCNAIFAQDTPVTIYTPEGRAVTAYIIADGTPWFTDAQAQNYIDYYGLDAEIIESATAFYNCHGYAWAKSENIGTYWIGYIDDDQETKYFTDGTYSNDGQPSYISASSSEATHGCYEQYKDHSIRVIQNGYPVATSGSRTHVSKWGSGPLVRHAPGHDVYALKNTGIISYFKLKTTHTGTLSSYPKTWIGAGGKTHTISANVTIPSGVTLSVNSGATITFSSSKRISVFGNLTANNATFQGNGTAGYWYSIYFYANSSGSIQSSTIKDAQCGIYSNTVNNLAVSNSVITNNSLYGFSLISSTATISNCTIQNNGTGINSSSSRPAITGCTIQNNTNYGINASNIAVNPPQLFWYDNSMSGNGYAILLNNASPYLHDNVISDNYHSIVITSSFTNFADPSNGWRGYNAITCSATPLFRAENYSSVYAGYGPPGGLDAGGYNSIFGSELPDMEAYNHTNIYACNNYWGSPYPAILVDGTSIILAWYPLSSDPNPGSCSLNKSSSLAISSTLVEENDISKVYLEAISNWFGNNISNAIELLKSIIEGKFDGKYTPLALLTYYDLNAKEKDLSSSEYTYTSDDILLSVYNRDKEDALRPFAVRLLAREAALLGNSDEMIFYNTEIIENYPNSPNEISALYDLVNYYAEEEDSVTASKYLKRMNEIYPDDDLTLFANINLGLNSAYLGKNNVKDIEQIPKVYSLGDNFPNPFNPTTTISFSIPNDEKVVLKVYDILGKEMEVLVNEEKVAGRYEVNFNASSLASGVYIYKIQAGNFVNSKKMMLLK